MVTTKLPAITIGIPFYNAEATLLDAVRSVFAQTHQDWELILLDDGSTDRSLELAQSIRDPRVSVYSDGQNRRLAARLNQMTQLAKYDFIARMDADDLMSPDRLEKQIGILLLKDDVDLVSTGVCSLSNEDNPIGIRVYKNENELKFKDFLLGRSGIVHASILARKSWFLRNPYDENQLLTEDYELWVRAFLKNDLNFQVISEPLYYYREGQNLTASKILTAYFNQRLVIAHYAKNGISVTEKYSMLVKSFYKSLVVRMLNYFGYMKMLQSVRNDVIRDKDLNDKFNVELASIKSTHVPGLG